MQAQATRQKQKARPAFQSQGFKLTICADRCHTTAKSSTTQEASRYQLWMHCIYSVRSRYQTRLFLCWNTIPATCYLTRTSAKVDTHRSCSSASPNALKVAGKVMMVTPLIRLGILGSVPVVFLSGRSLEASPRKRTSFWTIWYAHSPMIALRLL